MIHSTGILLLSTVIDFYFRVRFNPVEKDLLCATVSDRSIGKSLEIRFFRLWLERWSFTVFFITRKKVLYDCRASTPIKKVTLQMQSNGVSWNPQEAMIFTVANEDNNLYSFDLRNVGFKKFVLFLIVLSAKRSVPSSRGPC